MHARDRHYKEHVMSQLDKVLFTAGAVDFLRGRPMRRIAVLLGITAVVAVVGYLARASGQEGGEGAQIFVDKIPSGYRDWRLISVAHEEGNLNSLGAILGNDVAIKAYREKKLPYPDGTIIAALHWRHAPSEENNKIFGRRQSFVAASPTNIQFMVKDSKKYASTGGWGFGHFNERDGNKPGDAALLKTCFACHQKAKDSDLVFTRYAP
jgi:Cytochrome P460